MSIRFVWRCAQKILLGSLSGLTLALVPNVAGAQQSEIEQLRRELLEQKKYIQSLEKRLDAQEAKTTEVAKAKAPSVEAGYDNGFYIKSPDKPYSMVFNGFGQFRYTNTKTSGLNDAHTWDVALARLAISGNVLDPKLVYFMQIQGSTFGNNNNITMLDWWTKYNFAPEIALQAGRFVLPYSREFYTHPGNLLFGDLSEADYAFNLPRSIGGQLSGKIGPVSYHAGMLNSIRALDASGQENFGSQIAALGRLEVDILKPYGYMESSPKPATDPELSVGLAGSYNPIDGTSSFQNLVSGDTTANVTLDMGFRYGGFSYQAAGYYRHDNYSTPGLKTGNDWGYYSQAGYYLIPQKLEGAARISGLEFDKLNVAGVNRKTTAYSLGLNYYMYGHNLKFQADYTFLDNTGFSGQPKARDSNRFRFQTQILF
jgi:Phosphate-selective porin O and P